MATLVLQVAGSAIGAAVGGPIGAVVGRALGALGGAVIDSALLGGGSSSPKPVEGPRLKEMDGLSSTEGAAIPKVYGRARIGGQLIWATRFEEEVNVSVTRVKSSGGKSLGGSSKQTTTTYSYFGNVAIGLCEGPIAFVRRIWANGKEIDQTALNIRVHHGYADAQPDPLIVAKEGAENAPAYRGLAYVVFERLPLADYGNRIPQFSFEVVRAVAGGLGEKLKAVCLIPGASEFGYDTLPVIHIIEPGVTSYENRHQLWRSTDVIASLDALQALAPNLERVSLVVSWFGSDLRAGACRVEPKVEEPVKPTTGTEPWAAGGIAREAARPVSRIGGRAAYGGTPSDAAVIRLIGELKRRGWDVVLYPFVMMDIPAGSGLPSPYGGEQPPYPWRGRIACHPAPGVLGSPDGTNEAGAQVARFFGSAQARHFTPLGATVLYAGPDEWSFRRMVLHYAHLSVLAGGVGGFVIGSELVGLTRVRSGPGAYPAVAGLIDLAGAVRGIVGAGTKLTYAADWTEYGSHVLGDEVRFPLDPLWAHPAIDAVGIDYYPPLTDWREGPEALDRAGARAIYDPAYLLTKTVSGEAFDYYYASDADRAAQIRTPITDGAYGKPWVYRAKDIAGWWADVHVERVGGVEVGQSTPWVPASKPVWLTEIGVPAVDKGTNGPNVFPDPKSIENAVPPLSGGSRDDLIQLRGLNAILARFGVAGEGNPVSPVYGGPMVDPGHVFAWAWDARPFPAFPNQTGVWADGANWDRGHWFTGRLEGVTLDRLLPAILAEMGAPLPAAADIDGFVDGYTVERPMSARAALEPLSRLYGFDAVVTGGALTFIGRTGRIAANLDDDDFVPDRSDVRLSLSRAQDTDLPYEIRVGFTDGEGDYRKATALSRRLAGTSRRDTQADIAVVSRRGEMQRLADIWLQDLWVARETADFSLSPRRIALEVGDMVTLPAGSGRKPYRITRIVDGSARQVTARALEPGLFEAMAPTIPRPVQPAPRLPGKPHGIVLDLPLALADPPVLQWLAVAADPWPGAIAVWRSPDGSSFEPFGTIPAPSMIGRTLTALEPGPLWQFDRANTLDILLPGGALASVEETQSLSARNTFALRGPDGAWEILSAAGAELLADRTWRLSGLVRGLAGSEAAAPRPVPAGADIVVLDDTLLPLATGPTDLGRRFVYRFGPVGRDHGDLTYVETTATAGPAALLPLAPVRASATRTSDGVLIRWMRRGRFDADAWEPLDIPLGEAIEAYAVDVVGPGGTVRTLNASLPEVLYPVAAEAADFGGPQATLTLSIAQLSATVGPGPALAVTLPIT